MFYSETSKLLGFSINYFDTLCYSCNLYPTILGRRLSLNGWGGCWRGFEQLWYFGLCCWTAFASRPPACSRLASSLLHRSYQPKKFFFIFPSICTQCALYKLIYALDFFVNVDFNI